MLSSKKMTQYFKEWTTPISVLEKRLQSCFCSMFKTTGQKSSNPVLLSHPVEKVSMFDCFYGKFVSKKKFLQNLYGKSKFSVCRQSGSQRGKNYAYSKVTVLVIISEKCLWSFQKEKLQWGIVSHVLSAHSFMKLIFLLNTPKTEIFHIF